jgi:hypothetical protein
MNTAPTIVRLIRFPASLRLTKKGKTFVSSQQRSGPLLLSERHEAVEVTLRIPVPGITFATGGQTVTRTEAFNQGEQRDVLLPWALVVEAESRVPTLGLEIDIRYEGDSEVHTATMPVQLHYAMLGRGATAAIAGAAVATAVAVATRRRKADVVIGDDEPVEVSLFNIAPTSKVPAPAPAKGPSKKEKLRVFDADQAELAVMNTAPLRRPASKKTAAKKAAAKKAPAKKAATKKTPARKAPAKKASSKKASASRRGSAASRSARRTGGSGSSKARKSPARRSTRKSR